MTPDRSANPADGGTSRPEAAFVGLSVEQAKAKGIGEEKIKKAQVMHRKAQFYLDFVEAENSMGFHAPQEAMRILGESINFTRQGQIALR